MAGHKLGRRSGFARLESMEPRLLLSGAFDGGTENDIAYDSSGNLHVAFFEETGATTGRLMYVRRTAGGAWESPVVLDEGSPNMGRYPSIEIDNNGRPGVAYYDASNADLKYRHHNGSVWEPAETIPDNNSYGRYPSLAYGPSNNRPVISYYHVNQSSLKVAKRGSSGWDAANVTTVENSGDVGRYSSLKFNPGTGKWSVAYTQAPVTSAGETNSYVKFVDEGLLGWAEPKVVEASALGSSFIYLDLAFTGSDPAISYYDPIGADLRYARRTGLTALLQSWTTERVGAASGKRGMYSSIWFNTSVSPARPVIAHYNESANRVDVAEKVNGVWGIETEYLGGGRGGRAAAGPGGTMTHSWSGPKADGANALFVSDTGVGEDWTQGTVTTVPAGTPLAGRHWHSAFVTGGSTPKMWIAGGNAFDGAGALADVWSSSDGSTWTRVTDAAGFGRRYGQATVVDPSGTVWMTGGWSPDVGVSNQVFSSTDGVNWTQVTTTGSVFTPRYNHSSVWFKDRLWVLGGSGSEGDAGGVYSSADGQTWTQETQQTPYGNANHFDAVVFDDKIWLLGGDSFANPNIYWSSDGRTWNEIGAAQSANLFTPRLAANAVVHDGRMWVIGGLASSNGSQFPSTEVWNSVDGINWQRAGAGEFSARTDPAAVAFGGSTAKSDAWWTE
jgi:hypothetical protein